VGADYIFQGDLKPLDMPSWVPDWRHTSLTPESLQRFESTSPNWKPSFNACKDFSFPSPFPGLDSTVSNDPEKLIPLQELPTELRLRGYTIAKITALTSSPWALQTPPCSQTIHTQALVLQENQLQIVDWEAVLFTHNPSSIYTPTGESNMDARYKTLMAGIFTESDAFVRSAYLAFERRQKVLRFIAWIGLAKYLWPFMVVVLVGHLLRYFGIQNSEIQFRSKIPGMVNRKGARLKSGIGATEYMGLVPGLCEVGDVVVICEGVKVPLVLRNRAESVGAEVSRGGVEIEADKGKVKWEFIGDAYVHGVMDGKNWDEKKCEDICIT
jgi:hypothetical protein